MMIKSEKYDVGNAYCRALRIWQALMIPAAMSFPTCDMEVGSFMGLIWTKIIFFSKAKIKEANPFFLDSTYKLIKYFGDETLLHSLLLLWHSLSAKYERHP